MRLQAVFVCALLIGNGVEFINEFAQTVRKGSFQSKHDVAVFVFGCGSGFFCNPSRLRCAGVYLVQNDRNGAVGNGARLLFRTAVFEECEFRAFCGAKRYRNGLHALDKGTVNEQLCRGGVRRNPAQSKQELVVVEIGVFLLLNLKAI